MVEIAERIPDLSDKELESFHANASRLLESGSAQQKAQAETLLPLLKAALEERRAIRVETMQVKRKAATTARKKKAAATAE